MKYNTEIAKVLAEYYFGLLSLKETLGNVTVAKIKTIKLHRALDVTIKGDVISGMNMVRLSIADSKAYVEGLIDHVECVGGIEKYISNFKS